VEVEGEEDGKAGEQGAHEVKVGRGRVGGKWSLVGKSSYQRKGEW
jgi:hypothetical protein